MGLSSSLLSMEKEQRLAGQIGTIKQKSRNANKIDASMIRVHGQNTFKLKQCFNGQNGEMTG